MNGGDKLRKKDRSDRRRKEKGSRQESGKVEAFGKLQSRRLRIGLAIAFSCLLIFSTSVLLWSGSTPSSQTGMKPSSKSGIDAAKAVILDGLYVDSPNTAFSQSLENYLSNAGFKVDVFEGENVTIDLLMNIAGYKLLILRLHSAVHSDGFLYVFSGEKYSQSRYGAEQVHGSVRKGITFEGKEFFAINAVFLAVNNPSGLNGSTIVFMGCNGTNDALSIRRLFDKGVKAYIGWNGYVDLSYSDRAILTLARDLYVDKMTVKDSVEEVMREVGPDPLYKSVLEYRSG